MSEGFRQPKQTDWPGETCSGVRRILVFIDVFSANVLINLEFSTWRSGIVVEDEEGAKLFGRDVSVDYRQEDVWTQLQS